MRHEQKLKRAESAINMEKKFKAKELLMERLKIAWKKWKLAFPNQPCNS